MRKLLTFGTVGLLVISLLMSIAACGAPAPSSTTPTSEPGEENTLVIGDLTFLTGFLSGWCIQSEREMQVLVEIVNEKGGINVAGKQYKIETITEDCKSTIDDTAAAAKKLVFDKKLKFVVGPMAFFCAASTPIFEANKVVSVETTDLKQQGNMNADTPYTFLGNDSPIGYNFRALEGIKEVWPDVHNIVWVCADDGASIYLVPPLEKKAKSLGFNVIADPILYPNEMSDFSPIGAKINDIKDLDAVVQFTGTPVHAGGIVKSMRSLGNKIPYIFGSILDCNDIKTVAGEDAATNIMTNGITIGDPNIPPLLTEIHNRTNAKYGEGPIMMYYATSLYAMLNAIEKAQSLDPDVVRTTWEKMDAIDTVFGMGTMGGLETYGIRHNVTNPLPTQIMIDGKITYGPWKPVIIP